MNEHDFDFRHHLRDTILLLGGKPEISEILMESKDRALNEEDVRILRQYNINLIERAKLTLSSLNKMRITVRSEERNA